MDLITTEIKPSEMIFVEVSPIPSPPYVKGIAGEGKLCYFDPFSQIGQADQMLGVSTAHYLLPLFYREVFGADLMIIVLTMDSADRRERVIARHDGDVQAADMLDVRK